MGCIKLFEDYLPKRPYHTDDLISGLKINKKEKAKLARLVQPNGPTHRYWMVFDLDKSNAGMHWDDVGAPAPNLRGCRQNQVVSRRASMRASASHTQASLTSSNRSWCMISRLARSFQA